MKYIYILLILYSVFAQHSLTDKCYYHMDTYWKDSMISLQYLLIGIVGYQYFINWKGVPISRDYIMHEYVNKTEKKDISYSFYYQYGFHVTFYWCCYFVNHSYILDCEPRNGDTFRCQSNCTSAWYKYINKEQNKIYVEACGEAYHNKYQNIM